MKKLLILLVSLTSLALNAQETPTRPDFNRDFAKNAIPGSYEEISFTRDKLIILKKYEPITEEKINALVYLRIISKTQGAILSTKHDNKGIINIPDLDKALKEKNVPLSLVQRILEVFSGPYTVEVLNKMVMLGIISKDEKDILSQFVTEAGYLPGVPPEQPVIVVKDSWEGVPLNSLGMIDTDQILNESVNEKDLSKFYKLVEKHQKLLAEFDDISSPKHVQTAKDIKKAKIKQEKEIDQLFEKMIPVEKEIADLKSLMAYLYIAGVMQNRYDSTFGQIKNVERDSNTLISCLLKPIGKKEKIGQLSIDRCVLEPQDRFICIDKTLLWLMNNTTIFHRKLAENVLRMMLNNFGHPPFDAPADMWQKWWQLQQKKIYTQVAGPTPKE
jgi:hypothetical protein